MALKIRIQSLGILLFISLLFQVSSEVYYAYAYYTESPAPIQTFLNLWMGDAQRDGAVATGANLKQLVREGTAVRSFLGLTNLIVLIFLFLLLRRRLFKPLQLLASHAERLRTVHLDLTELPPMTHRDEFGSLRESWNHLFDSVRSSFFKIFSTTTDTIVSASRFERKMIDVSGKIENMRLLLAQSMLETREINRSIQEHDNAIQEISSAGQDLAQLTDNLSMLSLEISDEASEGRLNIEEVSRVLKDVRANMDTLAHIASDLVEKLNVISSIMQTITDISDKTNLLSLNASIEAARAGEQGRGFAVVADEVSKLAEESKNAVKIISQSLEDIVSEVRQNSSSSQSMAEQMGDLFTRNFAAMEHISTILSKVQTISEKVQDVASHSEELGAIITEVSETSQFIRKRTANMEEKIQNVLVEGQVIDEEAIELKENMETTVENSLNILHGIKTYKVFRENDFRYQVEQAMEAHKNWVNNLEKIVREDLVRDIEQNHHRCRFGVFYDNSPAPSNCEEEWSAIDNLHRQVHNSAGRIFELMEKGSKEEALSAVQSVRKISLDLIKLLQFCANEYSSSEK